VEIFSSTDAADLLSGTQEDDILYGLGGGREAKTMNDWNLDFWQLF
jgi:hypothetical protein